MKFKQYSKTDAFLLERAPSECGVSIGKTSRKCISKPTFYIHQDDRWVCGRHLKKALEPECPICFNSISSKQEEELPCGHAFHLKCLTMWEKVGKKSCPLCRCEYEYVNRDEVINISDFTQIELQREHEQLLYYQHIWTFLNRTVDFVDFTSV